MSENLRFDLLANDRASAVFDKVGKSAGDTESRFAKAGAGLAKFGKVAAVGLAAGVGVAAVALAGMTKNAVEDEAAQRKLALGLKNAAGATDQQVGAAERWITAQGKALGVTDDELRPALQKLAQSTGDVGKAQGQLKIAMDVAAGSGKSLKSVTEAIMKANNGSVGGLSKLGIATKDAAGETMGLDQIMGKAANTFRGQAATQADSLGGKMTRLKVMFDETKEAIGARLIPILSTMADWFMNKAVPAIQSTYDMLAKKFGPTISDIGGWISGTLVPAIQKFVGQMKSGEGAGGRFKDVFDKVSDVLGKVASFIGDNKTAVATFVGIIGTVVAITKTWTAVQAALNFVMAANPLTLIVIAIAALAAGLVIAYKRSDTFRDIVDTALRVVGAAGKWMWENALKPAFEKLKDGFDALGKAGTWLWNNALQPAFKFIVSGVASILDMWSSMLGVLAKVPGFGWAAKAADAMAGAADKARALADGIQKIPTSKTVTIAFKYTGLRGPGGSGPTRGGAGDLGILPRGQIETESIKLGELFSKSFAGGIKSKIKTAIAAVGELTSRAGEKLQGLKDKAAEISRSVADAMTGALDVGGLGSTNEDGSKNSVTDQLASFAAQAGEFAKSLATAAGNGLNSNLIAKIANMGPSQGLTAAQALAALDQSQIASANASLATVDKFAGQLGQTVLTTTSLPGDIARQQGVLDTLLAIQSDLRNNPGNISFTVNDATDPDAVVAAIRKYIKRNGKLRDVAAPA